MSLRELSFNVANLLLFDFVYRLSRRGDDYADIRDIRGASVLLTRSILQYLLPGESK